MRLIFSPQVNPNLSLTLTKTGDVLTLNGADLDLTFLPEGSTIPAEAVGSDFIIGPITRTAGVLEIHLLLPIPDKAHEWLKFPEPMLVTVDGPISFEEDWR